MADIKNLFWLSEKFVTRKNKPIIIPQNFAKYLLNIPNFAEIFFMCTKIYLGSADISSRQTIKFEICGKRTAFV
ncbi:MAG: hypothetical protein Q4G13_05115, partial [Moraxella sp.]|nr:hypothetical protein [Moraxella sp.]